MLTKMLNKIPKKAKNTNCKTSLILLNLTAINPYKKHVIFDLHQ